MKKMIPFTLLLLTVLGCASSKKLQEVHIECAVLYQSEVKKMERVGIADTTVAFVSLKIWDKNNFEYLPFTNVSFTRVGEYKSYDGMADLDGRYATFLPIGNYRLRISYLGYDAIDAEPIELKSGEIWEVDVEMQALQTWEKRKLIRSVN